jgi:hypothetical protein
LAPEKAECVRIGFLPGKKSSGEMDEILVVVSA